MMFTSGVYAGTVIKSYKTPRGNMATVEKMDMHKGRVGLTINGEKILKETLYISSTTYVPLRAVSEMLGAEVVYNNKTMAADITLEDPKELKTKIKILEEKAQQNDKLALKIEELESTLEHLQNQSNTEQETDYIVRETANFIFHFAPKIFDEGKNLIEEAELFVKEFEKFYGPNTLNNKVDIWLYDDEGIFKYINASYYSPQDDIIMFAYSSNTKEKGGNPTYVLAHELIHAFQFHKYSNAQFGAHTAWFTEGQADYFAKQILGLPQYSHEPSGVANWNKDFYLKEFNSRYVNNSWYGKRDWSRYQKITDLNLNINDYFGFHSLVYFLVETYGMDRYKMFSDEMGARTEPNRAFLKIYNKNEEQLMVEFKKFFQVLN